MLWKFFAKDPIDKNKPFRRQAIIWTKGCLVYYCLYATLGLNESHNLDSD